MTKTAFNLALLVGVIYLCLLDIVSAAAVQDESNRQAIQQWQRFVEEGEIEKAAEVVKGLIMKYPRSGNIRAALVATYLKASWLDEALAAAQEAEKALPNDPEVLNALVVCHIATGNFVAARDKGLIALCIARTQGLPPRETLELRFHVGLAHLLQGETAQALTLLEGIAQEEPTKSRLRPLAAAYRLSGREMAARRILDKLQQPPSEILRAWEALKQQLQKEETPHFSVWFPPRLSASEREKIRLDLEQTYQRLSTAFGGNPEGKVPVLICPDRATFSRVSPSSLAEGEGGGWYGYGMLLVAPLEEIRRRGFSLQVIVAHELTLHFVETLSNQEAPAWLAKGLAEQETLAARQEETSDFAKALQSESLYPLRATEVMGVSTGQRWTIQVAFVAKFLIQAYGYPGIGRFLRQVREKKNVEAALQSAFGLTYEELEKRWKEFARAQLKDLPPASKEKQ